jgi:hypothetical protein
VGVLAHKGFWYLWACAPGGTYRTNEAYRAGELSARAESEESARIRSAPLLAPRFQLLAPKTDY